ncbi:ribonuclease H-like domain-containing protein [Tanacetum coccineum]
MKSGIKTLNTVGQNFSKVAVSVNTARPINTAYPRPTVNSARTASNTFNRAHSHIRRPFNTSTTNKNSNLNEKVNTVKGNVTTAGPKAIVSDKKGNEANAVKASACWVWRSKKKVLDHGNPQLELQEKGVIDSGCSRHMTGNKSYLSYYEEIDGGFVAFGGDPKGGRITGKGKISTDTDCVVLSHDFKLLDENHWMLLSTLTETSLDLSYYDEIDVDCCLGGDPKGGRKPALSFMRPFGCPVTILNTIDHLGMFDGKADEGFFIGYSTIRKHSQGYSTSKLDGGKAREKDAKDLENEDSEVPNTEESRVNQEQDANVNITNNIDTIVYSDDDEGVDAKANMTNLDSHILVSPTPTTRIHKDHPLEQIIRDIYSAPQTRRMTKNVTKHVEPKKNKKDERGIVIRNKARLVAQGYTQKEGIDYDEVFAPVSRIEAIRLFLAHASFKDFVMFEDPEFLNRVYKVEKALYGLHQALRACQDKYMDEISKKFGFSTVKTTSKPMETSKPLLKDVEAEDVDVYLYRSMIRSLMYLTASRPDIMFAVCACARFQVKPKISHLYAVKRIFRYLKGQPKLGLWYPKDSPFDLEAYTDNDYASASLDRKSTTRAASSCCGQMRTVISSREDKMERAATTSLEAKQDSRAKIPYWGGAEAQIRFKVASKQSNNPPLSRLNTLGSGEDNMKLNELMEFCTKLSVRALDL